MVKLKQNKRNPAEQHPGYAPDRVVWKGLTERQWFIGTLVVSGLLLLFAFRGCILPSGVGPKSKPSASPSPVASVAPAVPAAGEAGTEYTVERGDTLSGIAQKNGVTLPALLEANNLTVESRLQVGQKLKIPR